MNKIEFGDCIETMKRWKGEGVKVQMCVTSPPYYGLRSYLPTNHPDKPHEIGLEETPDEYIARMVDVFRGVRDILSDDGVIFINIGDSYYNYRPGKGQAVVQQTVSNSKRDTPDSCPRRGNKLEGLKEKDLIGIPFRLAFALQQDGWYWRQNIIWCISGGAHVYAQTLKGEMPVMVKDLVKMNPTDVKLWNGNKWTKVLGWGRSTDTAEKIELVLRSGERIGCTGNHLWPTQRGNVHTNQLKIGDIIQTCILPEPKNTARPTYLTDGLLWLIGLFLAEGSRADDTMQLSLNSKEMIWLPNISQAVEDAGASMTYTVDGNSLNVRMYGRVLNSILTEFVIGNTAKNKHLSQKTWMLPNDCLKMLIKGYFDGDGHYDESNSRIRLAFTRNYLLEHNFRTLSARLGSKLTLTPTTDTLNGKPHNTFRGEWRWERSGHFNQKHMGEIIEIRKSRARQFWDISVSDEPNLFSLSSGVLTHNCKPNPLPESVKDRFTNAHEYILMFSKKSHYFFDNYAVREKTASAGGKPRVFGSKNQVGTMRQDIGNTFCDTGFRNKRSVWTVATKPLKESHFAAYPPELIEPCILAGTSEFGHCPQCGARWKRVVESESKEVERHDTGHGAHCPPSHHSGQTPHRKGNFEQIIKSVEWKASCECGLDPVPDVVLDPFMGSGTTAMVALTHNRQYLGCELNTDYKSIQIKRVDPIEKKIETFTNLFDTE